MKRTRILVICFFGMIVLLLLLLTVYLKKSREEDLFRQENPENTLGKNTTGQPTIFVDQDDQETQTDSKEISEEFSASEEPTGAEAPMIDNKAQQDTGQQEATMETGGQNMLDSFYYKELTQEIKDRINGKSYGVDCDVPYEELRYVSVLHWGFDGQTHTGEMIVNKAIAEDVIEIFAELYEAGYPIERMVLVDEYDADDNTSMAANNSSAFNYRIIEGTKRISLHSYGMAIDINPLYNPYVHVVEGERVVTPVEGAKYEDRSLDCPYYIHEEDICYEAFIKRGFTWGGAWKNNKDYQHFQKVLPED